MDVYKGELEWLDEVEVEHPIAGETIKWPRDFVKTYAAATKLAQTDGNSKQEAAYGFLQALVGIHPTYDRADQPYSPWISGPGGRSEMPSDLSTKDINAIRKLLVKVSHRSLRAHLLDMLVVGPSKDFRAAAEAAPLFIEIGQELVGKGQAHEMKDAFRRAIQLARRVGWTNEFGDKAREAVFTTTRQLDKVPYAYDLEVCLRLLREEHLGEMQEWRDVARRALQYHKAQGNEREVQDLGNEIVGFSQLSQDVDGEHEALCEIGESFVRQAAKRVLQKDNMPFMAGSQFLKQGIESLRRGKAGRERIEELFSLLREYQAKIGGGRNGEMATISRSVDVPFLFEATRKHISGKTFHEALLNFAFGTDTVNPARLRERIVEQSAESRFHDLFTTYVFDQAGRTQSIREGFADKTGADYEEGIELRMIEDTCRFDWSFRVQTHITIGQSIIYSEHHPDIESLLPLVVNNPFIPPGHEELFLRGLLAGFNGDLVLASHLLVPQFENSIRHVLEAHGIHVATLKEDTTESLKVWGGILDIPKAVEVFGESVIFEIKGLLVDPRGYNLRNELAHGMLRANQFYTSAGLNAWWLMLRLCLQPVTDRFISTDETPEDEGDADKPSPSVAPKGE